MGERNSLCERIRNARTNLANAEQSFEAKQDVRGELDLMLAEAEMQNLRKRRTKRMLWTRQLLAGLCAVLVLIGVYGGWLWAHTQEKEFPEVPAVTAAAQVDTSGKAFSVVKTNLASNAPPVASVPKAAAALIDNAVATTEVRQVQERPIVPVQQAEMPVAASEKQQQLQPPVRVPQQTNVQLSSQQMHQLVRSGRQALNSNK